MNLNNEESITDVITEKQEKQPTVIALNETLIYPDSRGLWLRFKDGNYHNSLCPGVGFDFGMFENYIKKGKATIESYKPLSKDLLLAMFPENKLKSEHDEILALYSDIQ